jgi:AcrR family transcriptional regulator
MTTPQPKSHALERRPRGRPRRVIDERQMLDAVRRLLRDEGIDGVSVERVATELQVSRATLYRTISSREQLLGLLFRTMTDELTAEAERVLADGEHSARERLDALIRVHVEAAVRMKDYLFVFFGPEWLPAADYEDWRRFSRTFQQLWVDAITAAVAEGSLSVAEPRVAARLLTGMLTWISRWYRPGEFDADAIAAEAIRLIGGTPA